MVGTARYGLIAVAASVGDNTAPPSIHTEFRLRVEVVEMLRSLLQECTRLISNRNLSEHFSFRTIGFQASLSRSVYESTRSTICQL